MMNGARVDWGDLLFSSAGRLAATPFAIVAAILFGVAELYGRLVGPMLHRWTDWVFYPAVLFCGACILSKRLHDRGRAGWWAGLVLFAVAIIWPYPRGAFGLLFTPVLVWAAVELGFVRGQQGFNGYGADPTA